MNNHYYVIQDTRNCFSNGHRTNPVWMLPTLRPESHHCLTQLQPPGPPCCSPAVCSPLPGTSYPRFAWLVPSFIQIFSEMWHLREVISDCPHWTEVAIPITPHSVSLLSVFSQPLNTKWYYMYFKFTDSCHSECTLPEVIDSLRNPYKPLLLFKTLSEAFPRRLMSHCDREEDLPDFQVPPMIQSLSRMKFYR